MSASVFASRRSNGLLYGVFVISGAAGLIYESIWSRYLGLFVGHSAYAQIIVLAIFLGGMSLGALAVARWSERLRNPLLAYALAELATGAVGVAFHSIYRWSTGLAYDSIFPALGGGESVLVVKWLLAALLILPQSILLGTTFPLMSAALIRRNIAKPGKTLSLLYFANSLGAAVGVLVAGFYLTRLAGLPGTLLVAALLNLLVALIAYGVARAPEIGASWRARSAARRSLQPEQAADLALETPAVHVAAEAGVLPDVEPPHANTRLPGRMLWRVLLLVSFGTAVASFFYEIAWIRMLSLVLGSATHSFELMLSAFILGIALGSLWIRSRADSAADPVAVLGVVQWLMGLLALATMPVYLASFDWMAVLVRSLNATDGGYRIFTLSRYGFCLAVMLPATFAAGMTLPLITRALLAAGYGEKSIGTVYGINTLGSIVGVGVAGLILMPLVGLKSLLMYGAILDIVLGVMLLRIALPVERPGAQLALGGAVAAAALAVMAVGRWVPFDARVLSSGVFRYAVIPESGSRSMLYYRDGRTATVAAGHTMGSYFIATNGKPDASLDSAWVNKTPDDTARRPLVGDETTQALLPLVALAYRPDARTAAVIGQGSGMTSHFLLASPSLSEVVTIEIEPEMISGSRAAFYPANRRVFDDPRSHFAIEDAKTYFASEQRKFDIIISEPSNPWVSGVSGLFTVEFYQRVRQYLTPDGVFAQWLHLYEINDDLVLSVLAAFHRSFPAYQVYSTASGDILILATMKPRLPRPRWSVFELPGVRSDLSHAYPFTPELLDANRIIGRAALAPLLDTWTQVNSDFYPVLDLEAERTRFRRETAEGFHRLTNERLDIVAPFIGRRISFASQRIDPAPLLPRINALTTGAVVRAPFDSLTDFLMSRDAELAGSVNDVWRFRQLLNSGGTPPDWRQWLRDMLRAEHEIHGGTAGVADEEFYAAVTAFAEEHAAPLGARQAIRFAHASARWDFASASHLADTLVLAALQRHTWYDVNDLRAAAIVAKLRMNDAPGARRVRDMLDAIGLKPKHNLRSMLLDAYIRRAEREGE
jgi:predicted membrane-bound spermidine synthase